MKREKKSNKKQMLIVGIIAFLMITSIVGFIYSGGSGVKEFDLKFNQKQGRWSTIIDNREAIFTFLPSEVYELEVKSEIISRMTNTLEVDATYDANSSDAQAMALAIYEIQRTFSFNFDKFLRAGLTTNFSQNIPIITCDDATAAVPVVYFKQGNETKVYLEGDCIIAEARNANGIIRIKDRLLYGMFGVIR